jgi:hypothetical protein
MLEVAAQDFQTFSERIQESNPKVLFFDQNAVFCNFEECRFKTEEGVPLFRDLSHVSEFPSLGIGRNFKTWVVGSLPELLSQGS